MKLYTSDNSELMEVRALRRQDGCLIVDGIIMGAMPTEAILRPAELRAALKLLNFRTALFILGMFFRR